MQQEIIYDFPDVNRADEDGLLAIGGNLSPGTLLNAYKKGIFPWYNPGEEIRWYAPDPRFVLFPEKLRVSHSMKNVISKDRFRFSVNGGFRQVIRQCRIIKRKGQQGTWIGDDIERAYTRLYELGLACSAEAWQDEELAGGLYGVLLDKVFFGESMFTSRTNAGKFAFIKWVEVLRQKGVMLIDCQVYTSHLESLGAEFIARGHFSSLLKELISS